MGTTEGQVAYFDAVRNYGVAVVSSVPSVDGEVGALRREDRSRSRDRLRANPQRAPRPTGYNVAHTPLELKPHTDLPSYHWPPSIQLLHFLVNEATGGETIVDRRVGGAQPTCGAGPRRIRHPVPDAGALPALQRRRGHRGNGAHDPARHRGRCRPSASPTSWPSRSMPPSKMSATFYDAYRTLGSDDRQRAYKFAFKTANGDLLTVHSHRVMHGRMALRLGQRRQASPGCLHGVRRPDGPATYCSAPTTPAQPRTILA